MRNLLIVFAALISLGTVSGREFTNTAGKTIEAEMVAVSGAGEDQTVTLKLTNGRTYEVPVNSLSEGDRDYIAEKSAEMAAAEEVASLEPSVFADPLDGKLVSVDGSRVKKHEMSAEPSDYYAFYFSASWCPPCRAFTPKLVDFYDSNPAAGEKFELIFVSGDSDEDSMEEYMRDYDMAFPAIKYRYADMREVRKYAGSGIPCLVVVDREGNVVADSYVDGNYVGPTTVLSQLDELVK